MSWPYSSIPFFLFCLFPSVCYFFLFISSTANSARPPSPAALPRRRLNLPHRRSGDLPTASSGAGGFWTQQPQTPNPKAGSGEG